MPRYDAARIEPKWQHYWEDNQTFLTDDSPSDKTKLYVLDMFPYPSGSGLHVGHPEGYTATDITCRYARMLGKNVLHPMGWDSFGLPAEEHAVKTGTHPRETTEKNIDTFRRQLKSLGFSYDWTREIATTDPDYYRWTQWIFLQLFDTWYDAEHEWTGPDGKARTGKGRPIAELPIPAEVTIEGEEAVRRYQDKNRLAYISHAPVNWCPGLGTVVANEEVIDGKSDVGGHPVERLPLQQWMLRITAYADRLGDELDEVNWPESIRLLQRNWIGRSTGAEVDFFIGHEGKKQSGKCEDDDYVAWTSTRSVTGFPTEQVDDSIRVYTTRPDTLYGATYMVLAPEHAYVDRLTTDEQRDAIAEYRRAASLKSDLDRTELAKEKTGVFTGSYAVNPVNGEKVPVWIADYVLASYGTGAIMAVPAHDERDYEFASTFDLPIVPVVLPDAKTLAGISIEVVVNRAMSKPEFADLKGAEREKMWQWHAGETSEHLDANDASHVEGMKNSYLGRFSDIGRAVVDEGVAVNSGEFNGTPTEDFKSQISDFLSEKGLGNAAVNYKLRDWLFSRQRYWGEPFPIWHELDDEGNPTGLMRTEPIESLPVPHPHMDDFKPSGTPEPMLAKAGDEWLFKTAEDGTKLKRETNSMPQWAGSCWYFMRFIDPKNDQAFIDPDKAKYWLPVDLYIGGAEHAVLHLLYARFWHKVLFDRGHLSMPEPFHRLVNQGMIQGLEYLITPESYEENKTKLESVGVVGDERRKTKDDPIESYALKIESADELANLPEERIITEKGKSYLADTEIQVKIKAEKMSKSRGNVINPDDIVKDYGADALRLYEMFMGPLPQVKPWQMAGVEGVYRFLGRAWRMVTDERAENPAPNPAVQDAEPTADQLKVLHKTVKAVTNDIEQLGFNTAISRMMEFVNAVGQNEVRPRSIIEPFVKLLSPFAPHIAEEMWQILGHEQTLAYEPWPTHDEKYLVEDEVEIPVQVNGKLKAKIKVAAKADKDTIQAAAESDETVAAQLEGKNVVKVIVVPGRMVNFVVKG